ncbi:hypothetical protein [Aliiroseovarius marinus]|uniref:hypothetical protein n=1 Tax=Aliiroseovarius marinus TaxID=2500159 RepID=UPI00248F53A1|nr:hypothetical protein [Aliiroseovarius marinus]
MKLPVAAILLLLHSPTVLHAQHAQLAPLIDAVQNSSDPSYAFVRCAALRMAFLEWVDGKTITQEEVNATKLSFAQFVQVADSIRHGKNDPGNIEIADDVFEDLHAIKALYLEHLRSSYASTDTAFDAMWLSDLKTCNSIEQ